MFTCRDIERTAVRPGRIFDHSQSMVVAQVLSSLVITEALVVSLFINSSLFLFREQ